MANADKAGMRDVAGAAIRDHDAWQKPGELAALLALCKVEGVRSVLEVGCGRGGALWAFAQLGLEVYGVDLPGGPFGDGGRLLEHGARVVRGDSQDAGVQQQLLELTGGRVDLVFIDGDHSEAGARADWEAFGSWARRLVAFHDICRHPTQPAVGVHRLWAELDGDRGLTTVELVDEPRTWGGIGVVLL